MNSDQSRSKIASEIEPKSEAYSKRSPKAMFCNFVHFLELPGPLKIKPILSNSETKNAYYAEELLYAQKGWRSLIKELVSSCAQQSDQIGTSCRTSIQRIERFMRNDLMTIEQQRRRSSIE